MIAGVPGGGTLGRTWVCVVCVIRFLCENNKYSGFFLVGERESEHPILV